MTGYTLRLGCGIGLGLLWLWHAAPSFSIDRKHLVKWVWFMSFLSLASGRLGYILIHTAYFRQNPEKMLLLHRVGGIHGESALLGGLVGLVLWSITRRRTNEVSESPPSTGSVQLFFQTLSHLLTFCTPAILITVVGAWWACMHTGCAWGRAVNVSNIRNQWYLINGPDLYQTIRLRYPVQLMGMFWALISAIFSAIYSRNGYVGALALALYCAGAASLTLFRGDTVPFIGHIRIDTIENISIAVVFGAVWLRNKHLKQTL